MEIVEQRQEQRKLSGGDALSCSAYYSNQSERYTQVNEIYNHRPQLFVIDLFLTNFFISYPIADWLQLWICFRKLRERGVSHTCHKVLKWLHDTR
jgi:hypothetical protein